MGAGRPKKYDALLLAEQLNNYIDYNDNPIIAEFCLLPNVPCRDRLYALAKECEELNYTIKKAIDKQEVFYEKNAALGVVNPTFAIFKLKQPQHGWTDKQQIDQTLTGSLDMTVKLPDHLKGLAE